MVFRFDPLGQRKKRAKNYWNAVKSLESRFGPVPDDFSVPSYKALNDDLARLFDRDAQFIHHYLEYGRKEGRPYRAEDHRRNGVENRLAMLASAGLPSPTRTRHTNYLQSRPAPLPSPPRARVKNCLALIATRNYLPFAELAAQSFLQHHKEFAVFLLLVDGEPADATLFAEGELILLSDLGLESVGWCAAKFNATEFVNSLKPAFLSFLGGFVDQAIYLDSDILVFSRFTELIEALESKDLVLIPHMLTPLPRPEQFWTHPNNGDVFNAGLVNAGCFGIRLGQCAEFLQFWQEANIAPGAFYHPAGYQTDQQHLNWALVMVPGVGLLRDTRYNVAYWNIHERNLRLKGSWGGQPVFEIDGEPLGFFHFSGYDIDDKFRLSRHDSRYSVYDLPAVAEILSWYSDQLLSSPIARLRHEGYKFDRLPNGFAITGFVRELLKKYEAYAPKIDLTTRAGADLLCGFLMDPLAATGSMLPLIAAAIYEARPDLQASFPGAHTALSPAAFMRWFFRHAGEEYGLQLLVDRFRRTLVSDSLVGFAEQTSRLIGNSPRRQFLGPDRREVAEYLRRVDQDDIAVDLLELRNEWYFFTDLGAIFVLYHHRQDLKSTYPDILGSDHEQFVAWLSRHSAEEHNLPLSAVSDFAVRTADGCLARIFSYLARREDIAEASGNSLLSDDPEPALRTLIRGAAEGLEYDLGDIEILRFICFTSRHLLIPLYLELPFVRRQPTSCRLPTNNLAVLPEKIRSMDWARRGGEIHASCFDRFEAQLEDEVRRDRVASSSPEGDVLEFLRTADDGRRAAVKVRELAYRAAARCFPVDDAAARRLNGRLNDRELAPAVNVFGHFYADTGVGESARGLACAISLLRPVNQVPVYTGHVQRGVGLSSLFQRYDYLSDTNVFVSYPHERGDLLGMTPPQYSRARRNIIHLAWEQKDANPWWKVVYDRYDEIWVISEFSATPFRRMFPERVKVVPNVLRFPEYPHCETEHRNRLKGDRLKFLFIFDANSSMERKNPEGVIDAFVKAFKGTRHEQRVRLTLKVGGLYRPEHSRRVEHLMGMARVSGLQIEFDGRQLSRDALMRLIAAADCYISLHRAEGFGYTMAEAMFFGVPVIASGYSGNLEYMNSTNSFLVPCEEAFVRNAEGPFQRGSVWGEPSVEEAAVLMQFVAEKPLDALAVGELGRRTVIERLSAAAVAETIRCSFDDSERKARVKYGLSSGLPVPCDALLSGRDPNGSG
jgi:glycosyltransferase involved in cell wall biosynthesis